SSAVGRFLQHGFERRARGLAPQLDFPSGQPHVVAAATRFRSGLEAKLVLPDAPLAEALAAHGNDRKRPIALEHLAPVRLIGQLHSGQPCLNLSAGELLEFLLGREMPREGKRAERRGHCRGDPLLLNPPHVHAPLPAPPSFSSSSTFAAASDRRNCNPTSHADADRLKISSSLSPSCRAPHAGPWRA